MGEDSRRKKQEEDKAKRQCGKKGNSLRSPGEEDANMGERVRPTESSRNRSNTKETVMSKDKTGQGS